MYSAYMTVTPNNYDSYKKIRERTHQQSTTRDEKARELMRQLRIERAKKGLEIRPTPLVSRRMEKLPKAYDYSK